MQSQEFKPLNLLPGEDVENIGLLTQDHTKVDVNLTSYGAIQQSESGLYHDVPFKERGFASIGASVINLSNTILGAGVLAIPYAMANSGVYIGILLFGICAFLSYCGLYFLSHAAREVKDSDFNKLSQRTMSGSWAMMLVDFAVAIKCFGVGTSYMIIIGDLMPQVLAFFINENAPYYVCHYLIFVCVL